MDQIIVVECSEDGDVSMTVMSESQFLDKLNHFDFGKKPNFMAPPGPPTNYIGDLRAKAGLWVIKGTFAEPKPVQVVTEYKL
jgi:hypothetical protein